MLPETTTNWRASRILEVENDDWEQMAGGRLAPAPVPARLGTTAGGNNEPSEDERAASWCLHPADQRARSRVSAVVEYSSQGRYVLVCPHEGEQAFVPDSPQWFEWLATLPSFRFIGKAGRFSAYREYRGRGQTRCWTAFRYYHHHTHKHYLGVTDHLTITCLEEAAATLQAQVSSR